MKATIIIAALLASTAAHAAFQPFEAPGTEYQLTAKEWSGLCGPVFENLGACYGYPRGIADVLIQEKRICVSKTVNADGLRIVGQDYLDRHDNLLEKSASIVLIKAFTQKWPCR